jgi:hypothetical protein
MERTALDLMEYFKARAAYTFSDEITLALLPTLTNPPPFGGKIAKLISIASGTNIARTRHFGCVLTTLLQAMRRLDSTTTSARKSITRTRRYALPAACENKRHLHHYHHRVSMCSCA